LVYDDQVEVVEVAAAAERPSALVEVGEVAEFFRPVMPSRPPRVHGDPLRCRMICSDRLHRRA
jgi:hypothetical protein